MAESIDFQGNSGGNYLELVRRGTGDSMRLIFTNLYPFVLVSYTTKSTVERRQDDDVGGRDAADSSQRISGTSR